MGVWSKLCRLLVTGSAGSIIFLTVTDSVASPIIFKGESMEPAIRNNDVGLCDNRIPYSDIRRGDIVIVSSLKDPNVVICKRVLALEGDIITESRVKKKNEGGYRDNLKSRSNHHVPRGHVWLEGDNKSSSLDSRTYGPVPLGLVRSRVIGKFYPFWGATIFVREPPNEKFSEEAD